MSNARIIPWDAYQGVGFFNTLISLLVMDFRQNLMSMSYLSYLYQATDLAGLKKELAFETRLCKIKPFFARIAEPRNTTVFMEIPDQ